MSASNTTQCPGCLPLVANQAAHVTPGGCLWCSNESDTSSEVFPWLDDDEEDAVAMTFFKEEQEKGKHADGEEEKVLFECCICYDFIENRQAQQILGCPTCHNAFHAACVMKWLKVSPHKTCAHCRSPCWRHFKFGAAV